MHSYRRTLWGALGPGDPDKAVDLHHLACRYLSLPEQAERIALWHLCEQPIWRPALGDLRAPRLFKVTMLPGPAQLWSCETRATMEVPIGSASRTVGFLDVLVEARPLWMMPAKATCKVREFNPNVEDRDVYDRDCDERVHDVHVFGGVREQCNNGGAYLAWRRGDTVPTGPWVRRAIVEVKIGHVPQDALLKQMNLYRRHFPADTGILALHWDIDAADEAELARADIHVIRLGAAFDAWVAAQQRQAAENVPQF